MSDIEIAQAATMKPINEIGASLGIDVENLEAYGKYKACLAASRRPSPCWIRVFNVSRHLRLTMSSDRNMLGSVNIMETSDDPSPFCEFAGQPLSADGVDSTLAGRRCFVVGSRERLGVAGESAVTGKVRRAS